MVKFLTETRNTSHSFVFAIIMLNTVARPEAVLDLAPAQVNLDGWRIDLNLKGRKQTRKYRPVVPITDTLLPFLADRKVHRLVLWHGRPVASIKKIFARIVRDSGLSSEITPYSLRDTMAAELRRWGVLAWEVAVLLGPSQAWHYGDRR